MIIKYFFGTEMSVYEILITRHYTVILLDINIFVSSIVEGS